MPYGWSNAFLRLDQFKLEFGNQQAEHQGSQRQISAGAYHDWIRSPTVNGSATYMLSAKPPLAMDWHPFALRLNLLWTVYETITGVKQGDRIETYSTALMRSNILLQRSFHRIVMLSSNTSKVGAELMLNYRRKTRLSYASTPPMNLAQDLSLYILVQSRHLYIRADSSIFLIMTLLPSSSPRVLEVRKPITWQRIYRNKAESPTPCLAFAWLAKFQPSSIVNHPLTSFNLSVDKSASKEILVYAKL